VSIIHGIASVLEVCLVCRPLAAQWDPNVKGLCGNQMASFAAIETSGILIDVAILLTPAILVLKLQTAFKKKIATILVFDAGAM
jgi:hypothetical protein